MPTARPGSRLSTTSPPLHRHQQQPQEEIRVEVAMAAVAEEVAEPAGEPLGHRGVVELGRLRPNALHQTLPLQQGTTSQPQASRKQPHRQQHPLQLLPRQQLPPQWSPNNHHQPLRPTPQPLPPLQLYRRQRRTPPLQEAQLNLWDQNHRPKQ